MCSCPANDKLGPIKDWHNSALNPGCLGTLGVIPEMRPMKENERRHLKTSFPRTQQRAHQITLKIHTNCLTLSRGPAYPTWTSAKKLLSDGDRTLSFCFACFF